MKKADSIELDERVISAMFEENTGNPYKRQHVIAGRAMDARFSAAERPEPLCQFKNQYGWCKLHEAHGGQHTVIFLGAE